MSRDPVSRVLVEPGLLGGSGLLQQHSGQTARVGVQLPREHKQVRNGGTTGAPAANNDRFTNEGRMVR